MTPPTPAEPELVTIPKFRLFEMKDELAKKKKLMESYWKERYKELLKGKEKP